ncbi:hypothetical protein TevJSym_az00250 [endosymbiont of Tevnia jerichonana (vent Tica)]|uniref:Uncharacterized protein n=1 Tax=endosymbiont of Tevnia jerichonana (vent Tica) TaxID=1049564 RepID=G2FI35_9GAMM|nr:hypothetical protein TevJSym_az00250 [endosymbiont of Tevnia jerichonana (vent Tica)]
MGDTAPEQGMVIGVAFAGYWMRDTPARSLPADEHHLHRKATIRGSNSCGSAAVDCDEFDT